MSDSVPQSQFSLLQSQIDELKANSRFLFEEYVRLSESFRSSVDEVSALVRTELTSLNSHMAAMDCKLALLFSQQGSEASVKPAAVASEPAYDVSPKPSCESAPKAAFNDSPKLFSDVAPKAFAAEPKGSAFTAKEGNGVNSSPKEPVFGDFRKVNEFSVSSISSDSSLSAPSDSSVFGGFRKVFEEGDVPGRLDFAQLIGRPAYLDFKKTADYSDNIKPLDFSDFKNVFDYTDLKRASDYVDSVIPYHAEQPRELSDFAGSIDDIIDGWVAGPYAANHTGVAYTEIISLGYHIHSVGSVQSLLYEINEMMEEIASLREEIHCY